MIKAYASYFASYLLKELEDVDNIKSIILFGSVAINKATKNSDVDIFIDVKKNTKIFEKKVRQKLEDYNKSREALIFKANKIDNKINIIIGKLGDWRDLKKSIEGTGIVLYGGYVPSGVSGRKYALISWDKIGKNRGAFLNKVYGFSVKGKKYSGLIEKLNGRKVGKSSVMIPIESREEIFGLLKKYKVEAKVIEVWYDFE